MKNALQDFFVAVRTSALHPRIVGLVWLVLLVPSLLVVWPVFAEQDAALARHSHATHLLDHALDADFGRLSRSGGGAMSLAAAVFALLAGVFVTGGVLAGVGVGVRERVFSSFLADGGRLFFRNLRALLVGAAVSFVLVQGFDALAHWWRTSAGSSADPYAEVVTWLGLRRDHVALAADYAAGVAFLLVVFTTKLAMARLSLLGHRSAVLAFARAVVDVARQPVRIVIALALFVSAWLAVQHVVGVLTVRFLEVESSLWLGLAVSQVGAVWTALLLVAAPLMARRWMVEQGTIASGTTEPIVEIPRPPASRAPAAESVTKPSSRAVTK